MSDDRPSPAFEAEVPNLDKFLELLDRREKDHSGEVSRLLPRRAVWATALLDYKTGEYGVPVVRRYLEASFAYGEDLIVHRHSTSHNMEIGEMPEDLSAKQREAYHELRERIRGALEEMDVAGDVPLLEGSLRQRMARNADRSPGGPR